MLANAHLQPQACTVLATGSRNITTPSLQAPSGIAVGTALETQKIETAHRRGPFGNDVKASETGKDMPTRSAHACHQTLCKAIFHCIRILREPWSTALLQNLIAPASGSHSNPTISPYQESHHAGRAVNEYSHRKACNMLLHQHGLPTVQAQIPKSIILRHM